ncbi:hypothetical protein GGF43_001965 [Coemansia sp. RSA 2618]|nr:hypothetical protein GGF43_001965 [Coemansia sp. RSA 2618]
MSGVGSIRSQRSSGSVSAEEFRVSKRKRYKSLAEVATVEGSRLLVSLGRLPGELYSRHTESRDRSQSFLGKLPDAMAAQNKRWSLNARLNVFGRSSGPSSERLTSNISEERRDSAVEGGNTYTSSSGARRWRRLAPLVQNVDDAEWEDIEPAPAEISERRRSKMAAGDNIPCTDPKDWDPLVYLKPADDPSYLHGTSSSQDVQNNIHAVDNTLGTLLTGLDNRSLPASSSSYSATPSSGLRRRNRNFNSTQPEFSQAARSPEGSSSAIGLGNGSQAAASIIGAEGAGHSEGNSQRGLRTRVRQTFQQVRDYFLAEFRPAAPILDLTYDRLYSQGIEDGDHQPRTDANGEYIEDNGDELPPLRQLIGRVLPRSVSRVFSPAPSGTLPLPPAITGSATAPLENKRLASPTDLEGRAMLRASTAASGLARGTRVVSESGSGAGNRASSHMDQNSGAGRYLRRLVSSLAMQSPSSGPSNLQRADRLSDQPASNGISNLEYDSCLDDLPRPPPAPWLLAEAGSAPTPQDRSRATSQPTQYRADLGRAASSSAASLPALSRRLNDRRTSHKNSLPPPRAPLTARMVSELNYVTRRSATPTWVPAGIRLDSAPAQAAEELDSEQLLIANYQKYAVERQSKFEPDEYTDYLQTPMLNFRGILDRGIQDYVHPGLIGELPTLWLPVKQVPIPDSTDPCNGTSSCESESRIVRLPSHRRSRSAGSMDTARMLAKSAPYRRILALLEQNRSDPMNCTDAIAALVAAAAADSDGFVVAGLLGQSRDAAQNPDGNMYSELQEVCVHSTPSEHG